MVSVSQEEQRELPKGSNHLQRKLGEQIGSQKLRKEWGLFHLEKAGYIMGLQVYERFLETVATSCSSSLWTREEEIGLSSSLRVSIWKNFLPSMGQWRRKKKKEYALFLRTPDGEQSHLGLSGLCRSQYLLYWAGSLGVYLKILSLVALRVRELYCGIPWGFLWRSLSGAVPPLLPGPLNNDWSCQAPGHYA